MTTDEKLDLIVFGATGYTGKLICEFLNSQYGTSGDVSWGIAGRSADKLQALAAELGLGDIPTIVADSEDQAAVDTMVGGCKVLVSAAGPYQKYGSGVVESCARQGTDYIDLCGEPLWMAEMIQAHEELSLIHI